MATVVRMPEIATGAAEAAIAGWLVAVGDEVAEGQPIVEIETEKATVEFEAEAGGVLAGILLEAGSGAEVGEPIAVLAGAGQSAADALAEAGVGGAGAETGNAESSQDAAGDATTHATDTGAGSGPIAVPGPGGNAPEGARLFASPLVRKLARERGLDLSAVNGTGPNGRIVRRDVEDLETAHAGVSAPPASVPAPETVSAPEPPAAPTTSARSARPEGAGYTDIPHTGMRRAIARRLTESKTSVPHFYLVADCRVDELLVLRAQLNEQSETRISVNDFVVKAVATALRDVPAANAIWTDEATRRFDGVDISVAVSVPDGLLTPVVRGVEKLSLGALSRELRDYATRAREGRLKQQELEGGSFSVSNLGMYGTTQFSAILNPPQSGILAVGAASKRPVVEEDGSLGVATVMTVTLSADHRVLDGALAAEWLAAFQKRIEQPLGLLI